MTSKFDCVSHAASFMHSVLCCALKHTQRGENVCNSYQYFCSTATYTMPCMCKMVQKCIYTNKRSLTSNQLPTALVRLSSCPALSPQLLWASLLCPGLEQQQGDHAFLRGGNWDIVSPLSPTSQQGHGKWRRRHLCWSEQSRIHEQLRNT